jgi:S-methylmethionine-dependent homocysteine/selenocysteine methylase
VLLDGATGTELERRGVPMHGKAWSASAILSHPDVVRAVHRDYIEAGAEIVIANTFSLARHMLVPAGLQDQFREMNGEAVRLALRAREESGAQAVAVAGSIAPISFGPPGRADDTPLDDMAAGFAEQADILAESGADLLILEMIGDLERGGLAVEAACATGLPVWLGFSCRKDAEGRIRLWDGRYSLAEGVQSMSRLGGSAALIMHTDVGIATEALGELKQAWSESVGPLGIYAHSGSFVMPNWQFTDISPDEYAESVQQWIGMGARIVGGCCGIGPAHIRRLKERFAKAGA